MFRLLRVAAACLGFVIAPVYGQVREEIEPRPESPAVEKTGRGNLNSLEGEPEVAVNPEQLEAWINDLVDPKFAVRQSASKQLIKSGARAMDAVAIAADSKNLELATRCLAVLSEGLTSDDEAVQKAARSALQKLTKSENKSVAQRAEQALNAPVGPLPGVVIPGGRRGQIQIGGANNIAVRVQVNNNNGNRDIKITENGKEIRITDSNRKEIEVTITETVNGMKKVTVAKGKDADDLKKNSPDAHAFYERYANGVNGNGIQLRIVGNAGVNFPQIGRPIPRLINPLKAAQLFEEVEKLRVKIDGANDQLAKVVNAEQLDLEALKKISEEIKSATSRLAEIKGESETP